MSSALKTATAVSSPRKPIPTAAFPTVCITPPGAVTWARLVKPAESKFKPGVLEYGLGLAFSEDGQNTEAWKNMVRAFEETAQKKFGSAYAQLARSNSIRSPIRYDVDGKNWPQHLNLTAFITFKVQADYPPLVLDRDKQPIHDSALIYSGCIGRCTFRPLAYGGPITGISPGVSFLGNFQWLADGGRLPGARVTEVSLASCRMTVWTPY